MLPPLPASLPASLPALHAQLTRLGDAVQLLVRQDVGAGLGPADGDDPGEAQGALAGVHRGGNGAHIRLDGEHDALQRVADPVVHLLTPRGDVTRGWLVARQQLVLQPLPDALQVGMGHADADFAEGAEAHWGLPRLSVLFRDGEQELGDATAPGLAGAPVRADDQQVQVFRRQVVRLDLQPAV